MSDSFTRGTANAVMPDTEDQTSPFHDEKHHPTSKRSSVGSHPSLALPEAAPVLGGGGFAGEPSEKAHGASTASKDYPSETPAHNENNEKSEYGKETGSADKRSSGTGDSIARNEGGIGTEIPGAEESAEEEEDDDVDYPGGLKLGLLTFGLCMATFTVALDNTIIASKSTLILSP